MAGIADVITVEWAPSSDPLDDTPSWTDITAYVTSGKISAGRASAFELYGPRTASVRVKNSTGIVDATSWYRWRQLRITATTSGGAETIFYGFVQEVQHDQGDAPYVAFATIECADLLSILARAEYDWTTDTAVPAELTGARVQRMLDSTSVPAAWQNIADGYHSMAEPSDSFNGQETAGALVTNVLGHLQDCSEVEGGGLFVTREGVLQFEDRYALRDRFLTALSTDSFDRTAGSLGNTDGSGVLDPLTWTAQVGSWDTTGAAARTTAATTNAHATIPVGEANVDLRWEMTGTGAAGPVFRWSDTSNYWYVAHTPGGNTALFKREAASATQVGSNVSGAAANQVIRVICRGNSIAVYKDGTLILSTTDSFNNTATVHGIRHNSTTAARSSYFDVYAPACTFSDTAGGAEVAFLYGDLELTPPGTDYRNSVTFVPESGTAQTASDVPAGYPTDTLSRSLPIAFDNEALANAEQLLGVYKQESTTWPDHVNVHMWPIVTQGSFDQVAALDLRDYCVVEFTPVGESQQTYNVIVEGIDHQLTPGAWRTTVAFSSADRWIDGWITSMTFLELDHATKGQLDQEHLAF